MLCQAKLRKSDGMWGKFTPNQKKKLPKHLSYLGLLLYEYEDTDRRLLKPFQWQLCREASNIIDVASWLKTGIFPSKLSSEDLIMGVGDGKIGTDKKEILDEIIMPKENTTLEIIIKWDNDKKSPDSEVRFYTNRKSSTENAQKVYIK